MGPNQKQFRQTGGGVRAVVSTQTSFRNAGGHAGRLDPVSRAFNFSEWQREREALLQKICERIEAARKLGKSVRTSARQFARRYNGRNFKSDPNRKLSLSESTLLSNFYRWKGNGCAPSIFRLKYPSAADGLVAPPLCRFVKFSSALLHPSMDVAWEKFVARGGSFGRGLHRKSKLPISLQQVMRYFSRRDFQTFQSWLNEIEAIKRKIATLQMECVRSIRTQLPDRPTRARKETLPISNECH